MVTGARNRFNSRYSITCFSRQFCSSYGLPFSVIVRCYTTNVMLKKPLITAVIALSPLLAVAASINLGDYFLKGAENAPGDVYAAGETIVFAGSVSGDALRSEEHTSELQ